MTYIDDTAAVYVLADGPNRKLAQSGYQVLRHLTPWTELLQPGWSQPALNHDVALALEQAPDSTRAHLWAAASALRRGDLISARIHRDRAAELSPEDPGPAILARLLRQG
jgi:hypothetical protein